ncbi:PREDICTED: protein OS-9-like isoform X2 [Priapulus caudatus]|uniref:Protein OS-9-like isoform X2 n=1 Tax=Priapulus caudatus TaxID=37621 RepID=A0ABM1DSG1_PRICU|nr:PREDICTED: protein OS-9-like isoform X2 [Priapulus caudatus]
MAVMKICICLLLYIFMCFSDVRALLDFEELRSVQYSLDILNSPVLLSQENADGTVLISSKHGQQYQCALPDTQVSIEKEKEDEKVATEIGISELLKPLSDAPCLIKEAGWWIYEFCYGKYITQYHLEGKKRSGDEIVLGIYESEYDWIENGEKKQSAKNENQLSRYHSQHYVNGTKCDLTEKERKTEVRFMCEEGKGDYIARIEEPQTCSYIVTVHTMRICHHPYLKRPQKLKSHPIVCSPALSQQQYDRYLKVEEAERVKEELAAKKAEVLAHLKGTKTESAEAKSDAVISGDNLVRESDGRQEDGENKVEQSSEQDAVGAERVEEEDEEADGVSVQMKVINSEEELDRYMKEVAKEAQSQMVIKHYKSFQDETLKLLEESESDEEYDDYEEKLTEQLEKELMEEYEKELNTVLGDDLSAQKVSEVRQQLETVLTSTSQEQDDDDDDDDAEQSEEWADTSDEETLDGDAENDVALTKLANALNKLLRQLDNLEENIESNDEELDQQGEDALQDGAPENKMEDDQQTEPLSDLTQMPTSTAEVRKDILMKKDKDEKEENGDVYEALNMKRDPANNIEREIDEEIDGEKSPSGSEVQPNDREHYVSRALREKVDQYKQRNSIRMRVSRIKQTLQEHMHKQNARSEQLKKLEGAIKEQLEKAGLDASGQKIQVRIVTTGFDVTDNVHMLSDEETLQFKNLIASVLGANKDMIQEKERHNVLEKNYNYVWQASVAAQKTETKHDTSDADQQSIVSAFIRMEDEDEDL